MPTTSPTTCERCNGTGQYHGTRRDGSSYTGRCFACQGYRPPGHRSYRTGTVAAPAVPVTITPRMAAFQAQYPAEFAWLQANSAAGVGFASSLLAGMARYGGLTPRQLAAVQRNLGQVEQPVADTAAEHVAARMPAFVATMETRAAERAIGTGLDGQLIDMATDPRYPDVPRMVLPTRAAEPQPITIDMTQIFAAFDTAAASGLRKVRLTLGDIELRRTGERFRHGSGNVMIYLGGQYRGYVSRDNVFHKGMNAIAMGDADLEAVRAAVANPRAAAATHGHDTGYCSCCRRLLTDPPSVMAGVGPICSRRFGWSF